ncbi:MAG: hypothetical protein WD825_04835 [Gemmatimonadaceae bacterium]
MIDKVARSIVLFFGAGGIGIGALGLFGIIRFPIPGNTTLIGISTILSGFTLVRFVRRHARMEASMEAGIDDLNEQGHR